MWSLRRHNDLLSLLLVAPFLCYNAEQAWPAKKTPKAVSNPYSKYMQRIRTLLRRQPKSARLHTILGRLHQKAGQWKQARASYLKALQHSKKYSHALVGLAHLALRQGKVKRARHLLQRVLRAQPRHPSALAELSELYRWQATRTPSKKKRQAYLKQAIQNLKLAMAARPKSHHYSYRLALLYMATNQHFQAHRQFVMAVALRPVHPCYHAGVHTSEAMLTQKKKAYRKLSRWLKSCRHPLMAQFAQRVWMARQVQKAQAMASQGGLKAAIRHLRKNILLAPNAPSGYLYLTLLLSQDQRCWEAHKTLRILLRRYPNHAEAKKLLTHSRGLRCKPAPAQRSKTRVQILSVSPRSSTPSPTSPTVRKKKPKGSQ